MPSISSFASQASPFTTPIEFPTLHTLAPPPVLEETPVCLANRVRRTLPALRQVLECGRVRCPFDWRFPPGWLPRLVHRAPPLAFNRTRVRQTQPHAPAYSPKTGPKTARNLHSAVSAGLISSIVAASIRPGSKTAPRSSRTTREPPGERESRGHGNALPVDRLP